MLAAIIHAGETIATNGSFFNVGLERGPSGRFTDGKFVSFDELTAAKAFIDAGKPAWVYTDPEELAAIGATLVTH